MSSKKHSEEPCHSKTTAKNSDDADYECEEANTAYTKNEKV